MFHRHANTVFGPAQGGLTSSTVTYYRGGPIAVRPFDSENLIASSLAGRL